LQVASSPPEDKPELPRHAANSGNLEPRAFALTNGMRKQANRVSGMMKEPLIAAVGAE
jgi:hypothetical protein